MAINPAGTRLYVSHFATDIVSSGYGNSGQAPFETIYGSESVGPIDGISGRIGTVAVIDTATSYVVNTIRVGAGPRGLAVNPSGSRVYVADRHENSLGFIDTLANQPGGRIFGFAEPEAVSVHPNGQTVYVANRATGTVSLVNTVTQGITGAITVGAAPYAFSSDFIVNP
jgi:YVTN family beta-propeller protein